MHQDKESNTNYFTVNNVTNTPKVNKDYKLELQQRVEETKTPILKYIQQTKLSHNKGKLSRLFLFLIGSIGTRNSIFDSGSKIQMNPTDLPYIALLF